MVSGALQKPENPKLCAVSPTFPEHFDFAVRLLVSAAVYATDTVDFFIILDDTKQKDTFIELLANTWGNYQTQTETRSKRFELEDIHILDLFSMLAALDEPYGEAAPLPLPEDLNRWFGPTHVRTIPGYLPRTFNTKRRYQMLKKLTAMRYLAKFRSCDEFWVLDSESFPFRQFSFADMFTRRQTEADESLRRDMRACIDGYSRTNFRPLRRQETETMNATSNRFRSLQMFFGISDEYFANAMADCHPLRIGAYDDRWFHDARKIMHMCEYLLNIHYPRSFTNLILTWEGSNNGDNYIISAWDLLHAYDRRSDASYHLKFNDISSSINKSLPAISERLHHADKQYEHAYGYSLATSMMTPLQHADDVTRSRMCDILNRGNYTTCRGWNPPCFDVLKPLFPCWQATWCLSNCDGSAYWRSICEPNISLARSAGACFIDVRKLAP